MATLETTADAPQRGGVASKGLKAGAIGFVSSVVIGVASTAPGYSLAASLGLVNSDVGFQAPAIMWVAFLPMLFTAAAFYYLNRADPDCGTTFAWTTKAFGPWVGWLGGWGLLASQIIVIANLSQIAGLYTFQLFGAQGAANSTFWVTFVGVVWILVMSAICYIGIEASARTQWFLLGAEVVVLVLFAVVALVRVYVDPPHDAVRVSADWLNPASIGSFNAFALGILGAIFIYWGWDSTVSVNEETENATRTPGRAAIASTLILLAIYVVVSIAAQAYHGVGFLVKNSDDVLAALGGDVLPWGLDKLLIIAVLTSASASTQTTILPATRSSLSMATAGALPRHFAGIHRRFLTPGTSTVWMCALSIAWYVGLTAISENFLFDSIASIGLMIAFYYSLTALACPIYFRRNLRDNVKTFLLAGVVPVIGAVMMIFVLVKSVIYLADPANSESGSSWGGLGPPLVIAVGFLVFGIVLMLVMRYVSPGFFARRLETADPAILREPHPEAHHA